MTLPPVFKTAQAMRLWAKEHKQRGQRIVLVPTMGSLHAGHLSLVQAARAHGDKVLVSIFVNPAQFGKGEDLNTYPRNLPADLQMLAPLEVDGVFHPTPELIYPPGFDSYVVPNTLAEGLCGSGRPGHFRGVCTVVLILFRITLCDAAVFGMKDFQQLQIIRRMTQDLWLDVDIVGMPIVRESDGLAKSSRNVYLAASERQQALVLSQSLKQVQQAFLGGERQPDNLVGIASEVLAEAPLVQPEYIAIVDAHTLTPLHDSLSHAALCALAARVGSTRLIDNCLLE